MRDQAFGELERRLHESGIVPWRVRRMILELHDHLDDLIQEALNNGCNPIQARVGALQKIGDENLLARKTLERSELKIWAYRYPRIARIFYPLAYILLLPFIPVFAGVANASIIARWGLALMLSITITAAMLLAMQLSISLG